jgi:hypothetical protein
MATTTCTSTIPNETFLPLTLSGGEDTIIFKLPDNGRTNVQFQLFADASPFSYADAAGKIASDTFVSIPGGGNAVIATGQQTTTIYVQGTVGQKIRIWRKS